MESKKNTTFSEIRTPNELIQYLNDDYQRLKNSPFLYQYTTLSNAIKTINGQKWHLGNAKDMNDVLEYQNGDKSRWTDLFFTCFMTEDKENIGMWSMYSQPWEQGVKITLPRQVVKDWIKNVSTVYEISSKTFLPTGRKLDTRLFLSAVAYTNIDSAQTKNESPIVSWSTAKNDLLMNYVRDSKLTGYIKDSAWSYEKEIRIKADFNNIVGFERVAIDVPNFVIDSMTITAGPKFKGNLIDEIQKEIQRTIHLDNSIFYRKLNIKSPCDNCNYKEVK